MFMAAPVAPTAVAAPVVALIVTSLFVAALSIPYNVLSRQLNAKPCIDPNALCDPMNVDDPVNLLMEYRSFESVKYKTLLNGSHAKSFKFARTPTVPIALWF